jgi:hypothetical protein
MFQYLEQLRKKPEGERRKAVLLISLCVTLLIALVWGVTLWLRIGNTDFSFQDTTPKNDVPSLGQTFSNFMDQIGNIIGGDTKYESTSTEEPSTI